MIKISNKKLQLQLKVIKEPHNNHIHPRAPPLYTIFPKSQEKLCHGNLRKIGDW